MKLTYNKEKAQNRGFSLVELIIVLAIMAALTALVVPRLVSWVEKSRQAVVIANAEEASHAAELIALEKISTGYTDKNGNTLYGLFTNVTTQYQNRTASFSSSGGSVGYNSAAAKEMAALADFSKDYVCWIHFGYDTKLKRGTGIIDAVMYSQDGYVAYRTAGSDTWKIAEDPDGRVYPLSWTETLDFWNVAEALFD